jgi:putative transposase
VVSFIDRHRDQFGVEPICKVLEIAPSSYYAAKARPPSARAVRDAQLKVELKRVFDDNFQVYGAEKLWRQLGREGIAVGRDRVARLMRQLGIRGVVRGAKRPTTTPADTAERPADLVNRDFTAPAPNRLWVADLTYVATWAGFCYAAFILDAYSRAIVGWRVAPRCGPAWPWTPWRWPSGPARTPTPAWTTSSITATVGQYLSVRYTQRLADEGAVASVGSKGDSYDNTLAEAVKACTRPN